MTPRSRRLLLSLERGLLVLVIVCLAACAIVVVHAKTTEEAADSFGSAAASSSAIRQDGMRSSGVSLPVAQEAEAQVVGRLEIRALQLSVPILSNYETQSLRDGIGHIPGTAGPGGLGTMGLAGHRDTYFRPLKDIRRGMDIRVSNASGTYHYLVDSTEIVQPEAVQVLDIQARPELTLITCYPFYYVGSAPQRFIVHAHLLSASPD